MAVVGREPIQSVTLLAKKVINSNRIVTDNGTNGEGVQSTDGQAKLPAGIAQVDKINDGIFNTDINVPITTIGIEFVRAGAVVTNNNGCISDANGKGINNATSTDFLVGHFLADGNTDDLVPVSIKPYRRD